MSENVKLSGKNAFEILLDIIDENDLNFMKQNYLNTSNYSYFFISDKISNKRMMLDTLQRKKSLETAYLTLGSIIDLRLSFFFGIIDKTLYYGFFNEDNKYVYKVGKFTTNDRDLKTLSKHKSMKTIRNVLNNSNLNNLKLLQIIKVDFHTLFENVKSDVEILDEYRIKNIFEISILENKDRNEIILNKFLEQWSRNFNWSAKCFFYTHLTEKFIHFYIKLKPSDYQTLTQKVQDHDII